jgi:hypothetical protein
MKTVLLSLFIILAGLPALGQVSAPPKAGDPNTVKPRAATEPCKLNISDMPGLHEIKYGMSYEEIAEIYPEIADDKLFLERYAPKKGGRFHLVSSRYPDRVYKNDFEVLSLEFIDGKIDSFSAQYPTYKWAGLKEAIAAVSEQFGLKDGNWTTHRAGDSAMAECTDFTITASSLLIIDHKLNTAQRLNTVDIIATGSKLKLREPGIG